MMSTLMLSLLSTLALNTAPSAHARLPTDSTPTTNADAAFDGKGYLYEATRDLNLAPVATQSDEEAVSVAQSERLELEKGDMLILEESKTDAQGRPLVRLSIDSEDEDAPASFWLDARDLRNADLKPSVSTLEQLFAMDESKLEAPDQEFVETKEVRRYWGRSRRSKRGNYCTSHPTSMGCCKSAVNYKLRAMGLITTRVNGLAARSMASGLDKQGWQEVHCGQRSSPRKGMTCTYGGGRSGHTEVWTGRCWYYGARCTGEAMTQRNRHCFSCKVPGRHRRG